MNPEEEFGVTPMGFGFDQFDLEVPEEDDEDLSDFSNIKSMLLSLDWVDNPERRSEMVDPAASLIHDALRNSSGKKVTRSVYRDGEKTYDEVDVLGSNGRLSKAGREYFEQARQVLKAAAADENGGIVYNELTGKVEVASWVEDAMRERPQQGEELFPQFEEYRNEAKALDSEAPLTIDGYAKSLGKSVDSFSEEEKKAFNKHVIQTSFDPTVMGEDEIGRVVEGMPVINPLNRHELTKVENWINSLDDLSETEKKVMIDDYHDAIDRDIPEYVRMFAAADAGPIESIWNRPLMDEFEAHIAAGGTGVDFLRANQERMSKDSYGVTSEIAATFRDSVMSIGTGAIWLAGAGLDLLPGVDGVGQLASRPSQLWGELAAESGAAYRNQNLIDVFGVQINRRDVTELVGQIGSFVALGGISALTTKFTTTAAAKAATTGASAAATTAGTQVAKAAGQIAATEATAGGLKTIGQKGLDLAKAILTDNTAYIGGIQAAGTSVGKTYNQIYQLTGDADASYKEAAIQGISDGLSAFIATSVMNRIAPGMERFMGAPEGKLSSSIIQRMRAAGASKTAMEETKQILSKLNLSKDLQKQFAKDLLKSTKGSLSQAGLRGIGAAADIGAEMVEESFDEILSDVISIAVDDSKTWNEDLWPQIQKNWRNYIKAGVLGAMGGGLGSAKGSIGSGLKALGSDTERKNFIKNAIAQDWGLIKKNVAEFDNRDLLLNIAGEKAVKMGEVLASDMSIKEKSKMLVDFARKGQYSYSSQAKQNTSTTTQGDAGVSGGTATTTTPEANSTAGILSSLGYNLPTGRSWKSDVTITESANSSPGVTKGVTITPISINNQTMAGAKVTSVDENGNESVRYVSASEAASLVQDKNVAKNFQAFSESKALIGPDADIESWSEVTPTDSKPTASGILQQMGYEPGENQSWDDEATVELDFSEQVSETESLNPVSIGGVAFAGAKYTKTDENGNEVVTYISAAEAAKLSKTNTQNYSTAAAEFNSNIQKLIKKDEQAKDNTGADGQMPSERTNSPKVDGATETGSTDETDSNRKDEERGSPSPTGEAREVKPTKKVGSLQVISTNERAETLRQKLENNEEVKAAIAAGVNVVIVENEQQLLEVTGAKAEEVPDTGEYTKTEGAAYLNPETGEEFVVIFDNITKTDDAYISGLVAHEVLHLAEFRFQKTQNGKILWDAAVQVFTKGSTAFDEKFNSFMEKEYPGFSQLSPQLKLTEASRAFIQGKLNKFDFANGNPFLQYLEDFLNYVKSSYSEFSDVSKYFQGIEDAYFEMSNTAKSNEAAQENQEILDKFNQESTVKEQNEVIDGVNETLVDDGIEVLMTNYPESAANNPALYEGDENIWINTSNNQINVSPEFVNRVIADNKIKNKSQHIADAISAFVKQSSFASLQALSSSTSQTEDVDFASENPTYIVPSNELNGDTDSTGGKWSSNSSKTIFTYNPGAGMVVNAKIGDVVSIGGDVDNVLVFMRVDSDGGIVYAKVNMETFGTDSKNVEFEKNIYNINKNWQKNRLLTLTQKIKPHLASIIAGNTDKATVNTVRDILKAVMQEVAPGKQFVESTDPTSHFIQSKFFQEPTITKDEQGNDIPVEKQIPGKIYPIMEVNIPALIQELQLSLNGANPSSPKAEFLISMEVSRLLSKWVDEEQIHLITMSHSSFGKIKINAFVNDIANNKEHPLYDLFVQTVKERSPESEPSVDRTNPKALNSEQKYVVGSELLRKVQQIRISGSFSEMAASDTRRLIISLAQDAASGKKFLKSAAEMIRRYMDRIHKVLWFRSIKGKLSQRHLDMLEVLNAEYKRENLKGDVDYARNNATEFMVNRLNKYHAATEKEISAVARQFSDPLLELRDIVDQFNELKVKDLLDVNEKMELFIRPQIRQFMEDRGFDIKRIDDALDSLNTSQSYQKIWTETYMAKQVMELKESEVDFDPNDFFQMLGSNDFDPNGAMFFILAGMVNNPTGATNLIKHIEDNKKRNEEEISRIENEITLNELRLIQNIDFKSPDDRTVLLNKAAFYGIKLDSNLFENGDYNDLQDLKNNIASKAYLMLQEQDTLFKVARSMKFAEQPNISYFDHLQTLQKKKEEYIISRNRIDGIIENKTQILTDGQELENAIKNLNRYSASIENSESAQERKKILESSFDLNLASESYRKLSEYLTSVDDFNAKVTRMIESAIGYTRPNVKEHGQYIRDTRFSEGKMVLGPQVTTVEPATDPSEVFFYNYYNSEVDERKAIGDGYPRSFSDKDSASDREAIELHVTTIDSNATFLGRNARMMYYIADLMGKVKGSFNRQLYNSSAGFAFEGYLNDFDQMVYETPNDAFPRFDGFAELKVVNRKLEEDESFDPDNLLNLIKYITKAEAWMDHIDQRINKDRIISEVAGMQTPAGRANILLSERMKDLRDNVEYTKETLLRNIGKYVDYKDNSEGDFLSRFARDEKGNVILKTENPIEVYKVIKNTFRKSAGSRFSKLYSAQLAANSDVKNTRRMVREFVNQRWIKNVEKEAIETIRDAAYRPDHPEMLELRNAILDPAIMRNLGFAMKYFSEVESNYWVGPMYAFDALQDYSRISGRGAEQKGVRTGIKKGVYKQGPNKGQMFTKEIPATGEEIVFTYGESGSDDPRVGRGDASEKGVTLDAYRTDKFSEKLTGAELAAINEQSPERSLKMWLTSQLMFLGYRSKTYDGNVDDARNFAFDVMRKQLDGEGNVEDLVQTGIAGMFPSHPLGTKSFDILLRYFYRSNPQFKLKNTSSNVFDAESFVVSLLEFKFKFEQARIKKARFENKETITVLSNALDASNHPKEEKDQLKKIIDLGMTQGNLNVYDSRLVDQYSIYLGENPGVSMLLMNLVGETLIVQPNYKQTANDQIGLRVIPGQNGQPNIVFAPNSGTSKTDQQIAIQTILTHYGEDPAMKDVIVGLADTIRNTLLPAFDLDQTEKAIEKQLARLPEDQRQSFTKAAVSHFAKLSRMTDDIVPTYVTGTTYEAPDGTTYEAQDPNKESATGFASDIALITNVLTDAKYKEAFDRGYIGTDIAEEFGLPDDAINGLNTIVKRLRQTDGEYVYWATENAQEGDLDEAVDSLADSFDDVNQDYNTSSNRVDPEVSEMMELQGLTEDNLEARRKNDEKSKSNSTANPNKLIAMLDPDRLKVEPWEEVVPPSDMVIFNALGSLLASVKAKNDMVEDSARSIYYEGKGSRRPLSESPVSILRRQKAIGSLFEPIFPEKNAPTTRNINQTMFVGSAINLTRPNVRGHTMLKLMMDATRSKTQQAAWLAKVPMVEQMIEGELIGQMKRIQSGITPRVEVEIPLNDKLIDLASELIPQIYSVRAQVEQSLARMDETEADLLKKLSDANKVLDTPKKWSNEFTITEAMAESASLRQDVASLIEKLSRGIAGAANELFVYENTLTTDAIQKAIQEKNADLLPEMITRISSLFQLIRKRDSMPDASFMEYQDTVREIQESLDWFNYAVSSVNKVASNVVNSRLKQIGVPLPKGGAKRRKIISPFDLNAESISAAEVAAFGKSLNGGRLSANKALSESIFNEASDEFSSRLLKYYQEQEGKGKNKDLRIGANQSNETKKEIIKFLKSVSTLNSQQIFSIVDRGFSEEYLGSDNFITKYLNMIALSTNEAQELFQRQAETGAERNNREQAEWQKKDAEKHLLILRDQKAKMFDTNGSAYIGKYRHVIPQKEVTDKNMAANVEISLVDPLVQAQSGLTASSKKMTEENWNEVYEARKNFYILRETLSRSLNEIADGRVDAMYKKLRGQTEEISGFNPVKLVMDAQRRIAIEDSIFQDQLDKAQGLIGDPTSPQLDQGLIRELNAEALAFMTNSSDVLYTVKASQIDAEVKKIIESKSVKLNAEEKQKIKEELNTKYQPGDKRYLDAAKRARLMQALRRGYVNNLTPAEEAEIRSKIEEKLKGNIKAKLQANRIPANFNAKRNLIGELFNDPETGGKVILIPQNARARLLQAFPQVVNQGNVNTTLANVALKALSQSSAYPAFMDQNGPPDAKFRGNKFNMTRGQDDLSVEAAGKLFSDRFRVGIAAYLKTNRNGNDVDLTGENSQRAVNFYASLVERLVYAYNAPKLIRQDGKPSLAQLEIEKILTAIDNQGNAIGNLGFDSGDTSMQDFDLIGTFAVVFAELESEQIMMKLVSGLSIQDGWVPQSLLKIAHHQDARNRSKFMKTKVARDVAIHLQAYLERGFDNSSGRSKHQSAHKAAQNAIAQASRKYFGWKGNTKDQAIGYMLAQLKGLKDASGMTLTQALGAWKKSLDAGFADLNALDRAQKNAFKSKVGKFFNANHVDMIRDIPLIKSIYSELKKSGAFDGFGIVDYSNEFVGEEEAKNISSLKVIEALEKALKDQAENKDGVQAYGDVIHAQLLDAYNATAVTRAITSKKLEEENKTGNRQDDEGLTPNARTYSSVPIRLGYAANPDFDEIRTVTEGKWIPDPADVVDIRKSAFYGGYGRHEAEIKDAPVLRPISINGLSAPFAILEDSLYRTNITPNYLILRKLLGKIQNPSGIPMVDQALLTSPHLMIKPEVMSKNNYNKLMKDYKVAVSAVASEIETVIFNDSQIGVVNTAFSQTANFASSVFVVRALSSLQQLWNQTISPTTFFVIKKLAVGKHEDALNFLKVLAKLMGSMVADFATNPLSFIGSHENNNKFHNRVTQFTKEVSPYIYFRGVDGQDITRDALRSQTRFNQSKFQSWGGRLVKEYQNIGESALDFTIGSGERLISKAIFMTELMSEMKRVNTVNAPNTVEELLENFNSQNIPVLANRMAEIKVSDMMGQSDVSKKSALFQNKSDSPVWSSLWKSLTRFSNHTATTASNLSVLIPSLKAGDKETKDEAIENIVGTLGQNIMFQIFKVHTLLPLALYVFYMFDGDDEERAARKAQEKANEILGTEESSPLVSMLKQLTFGSEKELFQSFKKGEASVASAKAEILSRVGMELTQAVPYGVLFGYSPVSSMVKPIINDGSEEVMSFLSGISRKKPIPVAQAWYERDAIGVREFDQGLLGSVTSATAPTSVMYDAFEAGALSYQALDAGASTIDVLTYLASEAVPFLRDYRSAKAAELREEIKESKK